MKCFMCGKKAEVKSNKRDYCKACFSRMIEKRVRKYIRINKLFSKNDNILVIGELAEYFIRRILKMPVKITVGNKIRKGFDKVVVEWSLDDEVCLFLGNLFGKKLDFDGLGIDRKKIKLFRNVTEEELGVFAKIKGLEFKPRKKDYITDILEKMQSKYPETRFSLLKSVDNLLRY